MYDLSPSLKISKKLSFFCSVFHNHQATRLPGNNSILLSEYRAQFFQEIPAGSFSLLGRSCGLLIWGTKQNKTTNKQLKQPEKWNWIRKASMQIFQSASNEARINIHLNIKSFLILIMALNNTTASLLGSNT